MRNKFKFRFIALVFLTVFLSSALFADAKFEAKYDPRPDNVTPVRNQNPYGSCGFFGPYASLESLYLKKTGTALHLSVAQIAQDAYNSADSRFTLASEDHVNQQPDPAKVRPHFALDNGAFDQQALAVLARWRGPILESQMPYPTEEEAQVKSPDGKIPSVPNRLHVQGAYMFDLTMFEDKGKKIRPYTDAEIKWFIKNCGAVCISIGNPNNTQYFGTSLDNSFNSVSEDIAWFKSDDKEIDSHAVAIVGWDDGFDKNRFPGAQRPVNNGAWLIKNSWGTGPHDGGYYWASYEDYSIVTGMAFYDVEENNNYDNNYGYDERGSCATVKYGKSGDVRAANIFKTAEPTGEELHAVSFYTKYNNTSYDISIYTDIEGNSPIEGKLSLEQSGAEGYPGYHTIRLGKTISLKAGSRFSVAVRLRTAENGGDYPFAVEIPLKEYSDYVKSYSGESFLSKDGKTWTDTMAIKSEDIAVDTSRAVIWDTASRTSNINSCIRAFTKRAPQAAQTRPAPLPSPNPQTPSSAAVTTGSKSSSGCNSGFGGILLLLPLLCSRLIYTKSKGR